MFEYFIALVMMSQYDDPVAERLLGVDDAAIAVFIV